MGSFLEKRKERRTGRSADFVKLFVLCTNDCKIGIFLGAFVVFTHKLVSEVFQPFRFFMMEDAMKYEAEVKQLLVSNAIRLIAEGGFEKATTKEITHCGGNLPGCKMNEVYIYRLFGSKELVYEAAFFELDKELCKAFLSATEKLGGFENASAEEMYAFFLKAWRFVLRNEERCRCYVRYYYSIYFKDNSYKMHKQNFGEIVGAMAVLFKPEANVSTIMHSVFTTMLDMGIRVYNGELPDNDDTALHVFNVLYCMMMSYFKTVVVKGRVAMLDELSAVAT